ncbi:MAG: AAA family ATPase [Deltaproteobacteria bacterium]|nr:AAA family ATPase [Deltaproteobacteria bacterium]
MTIKELPLGGQNFQTIIDGNYLYADKTTYIYDLLKNSKQNYFLSRPRRFGKTLLISVLRELFSGQRERFQGLWIGQSDYAFPKVPVIHLTFNWDAYSPDIARENLISNLSSIAEQEDLKIDAPSPAKYFGALIKALYLKYNQTQVAILVDEYDAPVTRMMGKNKAIALENAAILRDFFAAPKDSLDLNYIRFMLVTGITRYGMASMDTGPNYFNDISLDPKYAGICGFTLEEFDSLFANRLEETLLRLKKANKMMPEATIADLRARTFHWYNGYNWRGETKVLNPYSIIHFFDQSSFGNYWIQSGFPAHLTALIKEQPLDILTPNLESYLSETIRDSDINKLSALPVLFHSGYLTVDKVTSSPARDPKSNKTSNADHYFFRIPNLEVSSFYRREFFVNIMGLTSRHELETKGEDLRTAFLSRNAMEAQTIFSSFFRAITYRQKLEEKNFRALVQMILFALDFEVGSELKGLIGRLDLAVKLGPRVYCVIELKYRPDKSQLKPEEEDRLLAAMAWKRLRDEVNANLAIAVMQKLDPADTIPIIADCPSDKLTATETDRLLAQAALTSLDKKEINQVLLKTARDKFSEEEIQEILQNAVSPLERTSEVIDHELSKVAQLALEAVKDKGYHGILEHKADEIIDLGLAVYGRGHPIKVVFGPNPSDRELAKT